MPHYKTINGIIRHTRKYDNHNIEHISTPSLLFVEALELAIQRLTEEYDLSKIKAISGSGQQHGSVWWSKGSSILLNSINNHSESIENSKLVDILSNAFSLNLSPIWMDSSTGDECNEITQGLFNSKFINLFKNRNL